jgi:hypothetical protein
MTTICALESYDTPPTEKCEQLYDFMQCLRPPHTLTQMTAKVWDKKMGGGSIPDCVSEHFSAGRTLDYSCTFPDEPMEKCLIPTLKLMQLRIKYYAEKYGITIHLLSPSELEDFTREWMESGDRGTQGVIVYFSGEFHVCPILFHRSDTEFTPAVLVMDCVQSLTKDRPIGEVLSKLLPSSIAFMVSKGYRLADSFSCRLESLMLLKYAMMWLRGTGPCDLLSIIPHSCQEVDGFDRQVMIFKVPKCWAIGAQITTSLSSSADMADVPVNRKGETALELTSRKRRVVRVKASLMSRDGGIEVTCVFSKALRVMLLDKAVSLRGRDFLVFYPT